MRIFFLLLLVCHSTFAASDYTPPVTVLKDYTLLTVKADGTSDEVYERFTRIDTDQAVSAYSTLVQPFNSATNTIKVLEAYTMRPDGKKIKVASNGIRIQSDRISDGAPMFSDTKNLVIVFPNVEKGSKLYYKTFVREFRTQFPGYFNYDDVFPPINAFEDVRIELRHDPKIQIRLEAPGMTGGELPGKGGMKHYVYHYRNDKVLPAESGQVDFEDFSPRFRASNFENYEALGRAYDAKASKMATVTPRVRQLADEITRGITERREQIKAIYNWVSRNIRYVAMDLGNGGVIPHKADVIITNRYGDCKDHATLMQALLAAKGISSTQALIQWGDAYLLPDVPAISSFNHAINYVPELDMYLDSTAQFVPFGTLPEGEQDKPVLLAGSGKLGRTPVGKANDHQLLVETKMVMQPDGKIVGTSRQSATGNEETILRKSFNELAHRPKSSAINHILSNHGETGNGDYRTGDPFDLAKPFTVESEFTLEASGNVPGPSGMTIPVGLAPGYFVDAASYKPIEKRHFPRVCMAARIVESTTLEFPAAIRVESIPKDARIEGTGKLYTSTYRLADNTLIVSRILERQYDKGYCDPSTHEADKQFQQAIRRDLRSQIVYR